MSTRPNYDPGDPNWTWWGWNNPYPVGASGGYPPDPECVCCGDPIEDDDGDRLCDDCRILDQADEIHDEAPYQEGTDHAHR